MLTHHILHQYQCLTQNDSLPCWKVHFDHRRYRNAFDGVSLVSDKSKESMEIFFALKTFLYNVLSSGFGSSKRATKSAR